VKETWAAFHFLSIICFGCLVRHHPDCLNTGSYFKLRPSCLACAQKCRTSWPGTFKSTRGQAQAMSSLKTRDHEVCHHPKP
jgi:hypothetical protein